MYLYVIRHGQSFVNLPDWDGTKSDQGLTILGHQQADALGKWLPSHIPQVDAIFASTMVRARETVAYLGQAYGMEPTFDDRLREIGGNRWDHTAYTEDDLPAFTSEFWATERPFNSIFPDVSHGEALMHFRTRVGNSVEGLIEPYSKKTVVVVCHGGVIETIFDLAFNVGPWRRCEVWARNTAISYFEHVAIPRRETWRLHYHDRTEHLIPALRTTPEAD